MGIADCDTMLMILGASTEMEKSLQHTATELVMKGFNCIFVFMFYVFFFQKKLFVHFCLLATAAEAGTKVTGGQSVVSVVCVFVCVCLVAFTILSF